MSAHPNDGGPAFPIPSDGHTHGTESGMSLRDAMAIAALPAVIRCCAADNRLANETQNQLFARKAFNIADAMISARSNQASLNDELVAALRDVIGWVSGPEKWHTDAPALAVDRARAALAKARGEA